MNFKTMLELDSIVLESNDNCGIFIRLTFIIDARLIFCQYAEVKCSRYPTGDTEYKSIININFLSGGSHVEVPSWITLSKLWCSFTGHFKR
jgi:hypothetical protein